MMASARRAMVTTGFLVALICLGSGAAVANEFTGGLLVIHKDYEDPLRLEDPYYKREAWCAVTGTPSPTRTPTGAPIITLSPGTPTFSARPTQTRSPSLTPCPPYPTYHHLARTGVQGVGNVEAVLVLVAALGIVCLLVARLPPRERRH